MREVAAWAVSGLLVLAMVIGYTLTNARIARLEERVEKVDDNFVQLSVPLEDTVRDISGIYRELDLLRDGTTPSSSAPIDPPRTARPAAKPEVRRKATPPVTDNGYTSFSVGAYDPYGAFTFDNRIRNRTGSFNDVVPDEGE